MDFVVGPGFSLVWAPETSLSKSNERVSEIILHSTILSRQFFRWSSWRGENLLRPPQNFPWHRENGKLPFINLQHSRELVYSKDSVYLTTLRCYCVYATIREITPTKQHGNLRNCGSTMNVAGTPRIVFGIHWNVLRRHRNVGGLSPEKWLEDSKM